MRNLENSRSNSDSADFLLIDLSNSFTKIARATRSAIGEVTRIPTPDLGGEGIRAAIGPAEFGTCVYASVVPEKSGVVERFAAGSRVLKVGPDSDIGIAIDLPEPEKVGADRLANAAFGAAYCDSAVVVVDLGTAATFDVVLSDRRYVGGVIAPGLEAMRDYLHERTALLPRIDLREPVAAIGRTTGEAMLAGAVYGYRGLVRGILDRIRREIPPSEHLRVLGTGGYAAMLAEEIPEIVPDLTLQGLRIIGCRATP